MLGQILEIWRTDKELQFSYRLNILTDYLKLFVLKQFSSDGRSVRMQICAVQAI